MTWGEYVKQQREARGWSMRTLASKAGLTVGVISNIEAGETVGHADTVSRIQQALALDPKTVASLVRGEQPANVDDIDLADPELRVMFDDIGHLTPEERESVKEAIRLVRRLQRGRE